MRRLFFRLPSMGGISLRELQIFFFRTVLAAVFAVVLTRFFFPGKGLMYVVGLAIILVGLAYLAQYLRARRRE